MADEVRVTVPVFVDDRVLDGVVEGDGVVEADDVSDADADEVEVNAGVPVSVAAPDEVADGSAPAGSVADEDAVLEGVNGAVTEPEGVLLGEEDMVGAAVGDADASPGTNATLWYSTLEDDGPAMDVHSCVRVSYRTTMFETYTAVTNGEVVE